MGSAFFGELSRVVPALAPLPVKGMIVGGEGRHFSSGANLSELRAMLGRSSGGEGTTLMLSQGVPMLRGGDELSQSAGRQQQRLLPEQAESVG